MAMGSLSGDCNNDDFNPEINTTPLVDVMLVLLNIFFMTTPVINHNIKIDLPRGDQSIQNTDLIDASQMKARIAEAAKKTPQPELHLRAERTTQYEKIAQVMAAAQYGGLSRIGFITEAVPK